MSTPNDFVIREEQLQGRFGGYLRNTLQLEGVTCQVCRTALLEHDAVRGLCAACSQHCSLWGDRLADTTGFMTYAVAREQSGYIMRGYKAAEPVAEHQAVVALLLALALQKHTPCLGAVAGMPVTHWVAVPSVPSVPGTAEHPLHYLVRRLTKRDGFDLGLQALAGVTKEEGRLADPQHFFLDTSPPAGSHVLVIDDTWTSGGHAQSAAMAVRDAGAAHVSILEVARWLEPRWGPTGAFLSRHVHPAPYVASQCPWTAGVCPR